MRRPLIHLALAVSFLLGAGALAPARAAAPPARESLFNFDWKFYKGDEPKASQTAFDDSAWRALDLPHDWSIEGPFDVKWASCTGYLPGGIGWYRKSFELPAELKDKLVAIQFDGVYHNSQVWCNGKPVGQRPYGYISFQFDLTPYVKFGEKNVIAVRVEHTEFADSRWYTGSGIYRNVHLIVTDKLHVAPYGVFVTTPEAGADAARVAVQTTVRNDGARDAELTLVSVVENARGEKVAASEARGAAPAGGEQTLKQNLTVKNPELWSVDQPALYTLVTQVKKGGEVVDETRTPFGVRTFRFDPDKGFFLNGKNMKLKGVCVHHDAGALGAAVPPKVWERRLKIFREAGANAIRMSHNPPDPQLLDLCDRMGFLVMDEAFDEWSAGKKKWTNGHNVSEWSLDGYHQIFEKWFEADLRDMVLRDRNHPSIIMWSIGNEIDYPRDPYPLNTTATLPIAVRMIEIVKGADATRPVTAACAAIASNLYYPQLDVVGYNYQEQRYADDHAKMPGKVIYGSENGQGLSQWLAVANNEYICGQFLWTGIDFLGEAPAWPGRGSGAGFLDLAGFKKPQFHFRQSLWSEKPMVYLTTAPGRMQREMRGVTCFTNGESVELFQAGKSLGEKSLPESRMLTWPVTPENGTLKAVGKKAGREVCAFELRKPGEAKKLMIMPDVATLAADGQDVAQIEVQVTDAEGNLVNNSVAQTSGTAARVVPAATGGRRGRFQAPPNNAPPITCALSGPGRIMGIENGDQRSHEDYQGSVHKPYQGRMLVYVQARRGEQGEITLAVSSPGLEGASVKLAVK